MKPFARHRHRWVGPALALALAGLAQSGHAQSPFDGGWTLQPETSSLNFQSVKQQSIVESSGFATMQGAIAASGAAEVKVLLDSVDTEIDLRNVRMRFLFFETFKYPEATITAQIDAALLGDLETVRRKMVPLTFDMDLHGVSKTLSAEVAVTLITPDLVSVSSTKPVSISVKDFDMMEGLGKLEEAANVQIIPSATVSFDFMFARNASAAQTAAAEPEVTQPVSVALEVEGDFDQDACQGRFEILSRTGNIYFNSGSSRLSPKSEPLLNSLADIIARCPGMVIEVGGHTDSVGSDADNLRLSDRRARSVRRYLLSQNLDPGALLSKGYGEAMPIASNDTEAGRIKNRRIEFQVIKN